MDRKQQNYVIAQLLKGVPIEKINTTIPIRAQLVRTDTGEVIAEAERILHNGNRD